MKKFNIYILLFAMLFVACNENTKKIDNPIEKFQSDLINLILILKLIKNYLQLNLAVNSCYCSYYSLFILHCLTGLILMKQNYGFIKAISFLMNYMKQ